MSGKKLMENAQMAFKRRNFDLAASIITDITAAEPENAEAWLRLGQVLTAKGNIQGALDALEKSQKFDPDNPAVYRTMGTVIRMTGNIDMGLSYLGSVMILTPTLLAPEVHLTIAELQAAKGDKEELRNVLEVLMNMPAVNLRMQARLWQELEDAQGLLRIAERLTEPTEKLCARGMASRLKGDTEEALKLQLQAAERENPTWEALNEAANLLLQKGQLMAASQMADRALQLAPRTGETLLTRSLIQQKIEKSGSGHLSESTRTALERLAGSPAIFEGVRTRARQALAD